MQAWSALYVFLTGAVALVMPSGYSLGFYGLSFAVLLLRFVVRNRRLGKDVLLFVVPVLVYVIGLLVQGLANKGGSSYVTKAVQTARYQQLTLQTWTMFIPSIWTPC